MKKIFRIVAVTGMFSAALALAGCNNVAGTERNNTVAGTEWNSTTVQSAGPITATVTITLKFNNDNTFTRTTSVFGSRDTDSGTYKQSGNTIEMTTSTGVTDTATLDGDTLVLTYSYSGTSFTFKSRRRGQPE